jgi:hypothetical protein
MAVEKKWLAVTATPLTANGTSLGIVTIADTAGFKVKGTAFLAANTLPVIQVQVQRVISPTQMIVGPIGSTPAPNNFTDVSAYTVALNATIGFPEQDKNNIPDKDHYIAVYEGDPTVADRVIPVDQYGQKYTRANTFPVNIIPDTQIPFTLGALAMPTLVSEIINGLNYDQVTSDTAGNQEILTFYAGGSPVTTLTLTKTNDGWTLNIGPLLENFLLLENGDLIELEDGSGELLLET